MRVMTDGDTKIQQSKTTLYYVGVEYHTIHKGFPPPVRIKQSLVIQMPALGESVVLDEVYAKDLIFYTTFEGKPSFLRETEGGAQLAAYIREAVATGASLDPKEVEKLRARKVAETSLSNEDLAEILASRGIAVPKNLLESLKKDATSAKERARDTIVPAPVGNQPLTEKE